MDSREAPAEPWPTDTWRTPTIPQPMDSREVPAEPWPMDSREVPAEPWPMDNREAPAVPWLADIWEAPTSPLQNEMPNPGMSNDLSMMPEPGIDGDNNIFSFPADQPGDSQNAPRAWRTSPADMGRYYEEDYETERDLERLKNLYPEVAKNLMPYIEDECDKLEFEGSIMFDEYPDKTMLSRITAHIYDQVKDQYNPPEGEDRDEMLAMNTETYRRYPPRKNWLSDFIDVLLFDEMFHRRCRRRNCRRY